MRLGVYVFFVIVDRFRERCLFHIDLAAFLFALFTNARNRAETSIQCQSLKQQRCDYWQTADQPPPLPSPPPLPNRHIQTQFDCTNHFYIQQSTTLDHRLL